MDSGFKNDQLRLLNKKIGSPNSLPDEYRKETIFEYLYEINKQLQQYHDVLNALSTSTDNINDNLVSHGRLYTETTGWSVADMLSLLYAVFDLDLGRGSFRVRNQKEGQEW
jgi:hypothetical protein